MTTKSYRRHRNPQPQEANEQPFFSKNNDQPVQKKEESFFQRKGLTVGKPGDKYEQEADAMADAVVNNSGSQGAIQQKEISSIQRESLATPLEDEKLGTAEQRMEEDKLVQEKPETSMEEEKEEIPEVQSMEGKEEEEMPEVQSMTGKEEEEMPVQEMHKEEPEQTEEEEIPVQSKSEGSGNTASAQVSNTINQSKGKGRALAPNVQSEMGTKFGVDFSDVNIHTDQRSVEMNKELNSQAFTHGKDVYFNSGKYNPDTSNGKRLLAHELTHVVQQRSGRLRRVQRKVHCLKRHTSCRAPYRPGSWGARVSYHCPRFIPPGIILPGTTRNAYVTIPDEFIGRGPRGARKYKCRRKPLTNTLLTVADITATAFNRTVLYPNSLSCHAGYRAFLLATLSGVFYPRGGGRPGVRVASARPVGRFPC